jgi:hypothetical protein
MKLNTYLRSRWESRSVAAGTGTDREPSIGNIIVKITGIKEWRFPAFLPTVANYSYVGHAVCDTTAAVP